MPCVLLGRLQENFEANSDNGAFEAQYRRLLEEIQQIYESAKEFHGKVGRCSSKQHATCWVIRGVPVLT